MRPDHADVRRTTPVADVDPVDPQFQFLVEVMAGMTIDDDSLADQRAAFEALSVSLPPPEIPGLLVEDRRVPGAVGAPEVGVRLYRMEDPDRSAGVGSPTPGLLLIHGGGMVLGGPNACDLLARHLVSHLRWPVVSVDYRLAPEVPYPGPLDDCAAALEWFVGAAEDLGVDPQRIGVVGESAGGGLAAGLALRCRDSGGPRVACSVLIYPMLDDRTVLRPDPRPHVGGDVWTPELNRYAWGAYLRADPGSDGVSEQAAPARAVELSGLPPTVVTVGALDLFLDEDVEYARRLALAGVPVELHVFPRTPHGFAGLVDVAPLAGEHALVLIEALRRELGGTSVA